MSEAMAEERLMQLEARHKELHDEVSELERRLFLTPEEQRQMAELKKQKLLAKDALYAARRTTQQTMSARP